MSSLSLPRQCAQSADLNRFSHLLCSFLSAIIGLLVTAQARTANAQERAQRAAEVRQQMYNAAQTIIPPEQVGRNLERDLECLQGLSKLREYVASVEKEYAAEIREGNQPYRDVESTIRYSRERMDQFQTAVTQYASLQSLDADVQHIRLMLKLAIENQAPAYFNEGNDIANRRRSIKNKLSVMKESGSQDLKKASDILTSVEKEIIAAQAKLAKQIIDGNNLPNDNYRNADRAELLKLVESTWLKAAAGKKAVQIGMIGDNWSRTERWEVQNRTLYKVERSQIQGFVLVSHDGNSVACYHVQIRRDHIDNDRTTAWLMDDPSQTPEPRQLILASKLKQ